MKARIRTFWDCEGCHAHGHIDHESDAGVFEVVEAIDTAHRESAPDGAPPCRVPVRELRVHLGKVQQRKRRVGRVPAAGAAG